mgnify:CR=1 FL=1
MPFTLAHPAILLPLAPAARRFGVPFAALAAGSMAPDVPLFVPAIGEFVIPELLGGPDTLMIGRVLWNEFFSNRDWPVASAVAIAMLVVVVGPMMMLRGFQQKTEES